MEKMWSSHPIAKMRIGKFRFDKGVLKLTSESEIAEFEALLDSLPGAERNRIQLLDVEAAEEVVRKHLAAQGGATKVIDSTIGERSTAPKTGTGILGVLGQTGKVD